MDFRERYKRVGFGREDVELNRALRSRRRDEVRREIRSEHFKMRRCMENNADDSLESEDLEKDIAKDTKLIDSEEQVRKKAAADLKAAVQKRELQLEKWKKERNRRRIQEKKRAKPVFKVGVVHHRVYSPPLKNPILLPEPKLCKNKETQPVLPPRRVTRATEKRLAIKSVTNQQQRENLISKKVTVKPKKNELQTLSLIPKNHQFKAPIGITPLPMFGRQAIQEGINENMELNLNSINILSTNRKFSKNLSINSTEKFLSSTNYSTISPKFSNSHLNVKKFNSDFCDKSINTNFNDSLNNSSVEAVSLKMSSDDQDILNDEENVSNDCTINFNNTNTRNITRLSESKMRSSKIFISDKVSSIKEKIRAKNNQEIIENQNNINSRLSIKNIMTNKRRSTKIITNKSVDKLTKNVSCVSKNQTIVNTPENLNFDYSGTNYLLNSSFAKEKKTKSLSEQKRSSRISNNEAENFKNITKEISFLGNKKILDNNLDPKSESAGMMDFTILDENKIKLSRRFTRTSLNESSYFNNSAKNSSFILINQQTLENQENLNSNCVNLMNSSFVNQNKSQIFKERKLKTISNKMKRDISELQDESLIKFSPSSIKQIKNSPKQMYSATKKIEKNLKLCFNQESLSCVDLFNMSSTSEPVRQKTPEKEEDNSQNFSLNFSLSKNSTPDKPPAFFSPYIVTSRGKSSIRKEIQRRRFSQPSPKEIPTKDTIMQSLNISAKEEERTAQYYKHILNLEINRLNEFCDIWNVVKEDNTTPEEIRYEIQAAVGQTKLLINKKFERFRSLVLDCETGKGEMLVTCKDLQGFWDMMYMEIKDCDNRFNKLEELKKNNWIIEEMKEVKDVQKSKKNKLVGVKKSIDRKKIVPTEVSSLRAHIMAARKKKLGNKGTTVDVEMIDPMNENQNTRLQKDEETKNSIIEPMVKKVYRPSTPKSSKWQSALKKISSNQKSTTSPLIVMKLSQMCKTPEVHLDDSILYINSDRTPAKSILKTSKDDLIAFTKSNNKVFFKEQLLEFQEIEDDNTDKVNNCKEPIERKLDFESDSFNLSHIENEEKNSANLVKSNAEHNYSDKNTTISNVLIKKENSMSSIFPLNTAVDNDLSTTHLTIPKTIVKDESLMISLSPLTLMNSKAEDKKKATKTKKQISFKEDMNESYSRTLRSRKFSVPLTPKLNLIHSVKKVDEDLSMEVDDSTQEYKDDSPFSARQKNQLKKLYLNADGIICQRIGTPKKVISNTPTLKRSNSQKSLLNTELAEDNANITVEEITKLKLNRRTRKKNIDEMENINESAKKKPRINSISVEVKSSLNATPKQVLTQNKLQENLEPVLQVTDQNAHEIVKMSKISSKKKNISKKFTQNFEHNEQLTAENKICEVLTPNRRKSSRIAQVMKSED